METDSTFCYEGTEDFYIKNGVAIGYDQPYLTEHTSYGEVILERLKSRPEFVSQINGLTGEEETFAIMLEKSVKCAIWMKEQNIQPGDCIAICTGIKMDMYVPVFAALYVGAVINPWWDFGLTEATTKHFLKLTTPKVVFTDEESAPIITKMAEEVGGETQIVVFGNFSGLESLDDILESVDEKLVPEFQCTKLSSVDDPALMFLTSGTTGLAKAALHSHRSLFGNVNLDTLGSENILTAMNFSKLPWVSGILTMLRASAGLEKRIIYPSFDEEITLQFIEKYQVNWMIMETSMAIRLQKWPTVKNYDLSSLALLFVTGSILKEKVHEAMAETFPHTFILQTYGLSELGGASITQNPDLKYGSCGRPVKNYMMKVIDTDTGRILGPNEIGEACFKSDFIMKGYYKNPEETKKSIDSEGWFHSGDLVHYDEEGNVFVKDRIKEIIKFRGQYASPTMIEQVIQTHPGVRENAVFGVPHNTDGELPLAFVSISPNFDVTKEELQKMVADALPDHMKLRGGVMFLDQLPHTASGKISRSELRKLAESYAH